MNVTKAGTEETHCVHPMRFFVTGNKGMRGVKRAQYSNRTRVGMRSRREWERALLSRTKRALHCSQAQEIGKCCFAELMRSTQTILTPLAGHFRSPFADYCGLGLLARVAIETTNPFLGN